MMRTIRYGTLLLAVCGMAALTSCSSKITDEQLARMKQLRADEARLQSQLRAKRDEKTQMQGEIARLRSDLTQCNTNKQFVQAKLAQWPDYTIVWPDWDSIRNKPTAGQGANQGR